MVSESPSPSVLLRSNFDASSANDRSNAAIRSAIRPSEPAICARSASVAAAPFALVRSATSLIASAMPACSSRNRPAASRICPRRERTCADSSLAEITRNTRGELTTADRGDPLFSNASVMFPTHTTRSPGSTANSASNRVVSTRALVPCDPSTVETRRDGASL